MNEAAAAKLRYQQGNEKGVISSCSNGTEHCISQLSKQQAMKLQQVKNKFIFLSLFFFFYFISKSFFVFISLPNFFPSSHSSSSCILSSSHSLILSFCFCLSFQIFQFIKLNSCSLSFLTRFWSIIGWSVWLKGLKCLFLWSSGFVCCVNNLDFHLWKRKDINFIIFVSIFSYKDQGTICTT